MSVPLIQQLSQEEIDNIIYMYQRENLSLREISKKIGRNRVAIANMLEELNIKTTKGNEKQKQLNSLIGKKFGKLLVLEDTGKRTSQRRIIYKCKCDCNNICEVSSQGLVTGDTISCGCLTQSKGEFLIEQYLKNNNIQYKKEYVFSDLKSEKNGYLRFDFAIFKNDILQYLIEFDGKQHFKVLDQNRFNQKYLEEIQKHDNLKTQYCIDNNIKLIRISYQDINHINSILDIKFDKNK